MIDYRLLKNAIHYGEKRQLWKLVEEAWELLVAVLVVCIFGKTKKRVDAMVSEMADVQIVSEQVLYLMQAEAGYVEEKEYKIDRQDRRLKEIQKTEEM